MAEVFLDIYWPLVKAILAATGTYEFMNYAQQFRLDEMVAVVRRFRGRVGHVTGTGLGAEVGLRSRWEQRYGHVGYGSKVSAA